MKRFRLFGILGGAALATGSASQLFAVALPLVVDDFGGGPSGVNLASLAPPQGNGASFSYAGAVGGWRNFYVQSESIGAFFTGAGSGFAGYGSFAGAGRGGIIYDGTSGFAGSPPPFQPDSFTLGYKLFEGTANPCVLINALADSPNGSISVYLYNNATDYGIYNFAISGANTFADYKMAVSSPTLAVGSFDPKGAINAFGLYFDGSAAADIDLTVNTFEIIGGKSVPESGASTGIAGLGSLIALALVRMRSARNE